MQGLDLSVVHFLCLWCKASISVFKTVDVGSSPAGHIQLLMLFKKGINMALDKNRIKSIANKHGIKVSFGSKNQDLFQKAIKGFILFLI